MCVLVYRTVPGFDTCSHAVPGTAASSGRLDCARCSRTPRDLCSVGIYDPDRFKVCWRAAGAIVFASYLAYLITMVNAGQWHGNGGRAQTTAINALIGLIVFGYPGFMYAVFGRLGG